MSDKVAIGLLRLLALDLLFLVLDQDAVFVSDLAIVVAVMHHDLNILVTDHIVPDLVDFPFRSFDFFINICNLFDQNWFYVELYLVNFNVLLILVERSLVLIEYLHVLQDCLLLL